MNSLLEPADTAFAITPHDTNTFAIAPRAVYVGTSGNLRVLTIGGDDVIFYNASGLLPIRVAKVFLTNTTAADIVGLN